MTKSRFVIEDKDIIIKEENGITPFRQVISIIKNGGKANGGGNPYHDAEGKFTTGPGTAFGKYAYDASKANGITDEATTPDDLGFQYDESEGENGTRFTVETQFDPEQTKALIDTTFTMDKICKDTSHRDEVMEDSNQPLVVAEEVQRLARRLRDYGSTLQMVSQWSGASQQTADRITEPPKKEIEAILGRIDKMVKDVSGNAGLSETTKKMVDDMYSATRAGYNTLKYLEDNLDRTGRKYMVDVTDQLGIKRSRRDAEDDYISRA